MLREGQHAKSRMGGAEPRRWASALLQVSDEEKTIAHAVMGGHTPSSSPASLLQHNTTIDANKYLCRAQMPEELQGKQTEAALCLSLYGEEAEEEEEVVLLIDNNSGDRKQRHNVRQ